jgi:hypothetical protein
VRNDSGGGTGGLVEGADGTARGRRGRTLLPRRFLASALSTSTLASNFDTDFLFPSSRNSPLRRHSPQDPTHSLRHLPLPSPLPAHPEPAARMAKKEENEDNICGWEACGDQFNTAEDLFNHVCGSHIGASYPPPFSSSLLTRVFFLLAPSTFSGRKSAGTLSLECKWTGCHAKASKRDHLTSHCRVHIALKPHVCSVRFVFSLPSLCPH